MIILSPVLALMLHIQGRELATLFLTLLLGTPTLACFGAIASALTLGLRHQGMLLALLVFPLYIPVLIFSTGAVQLAGQGFDVSGQLALLAAILILALALLPWASFAALKIGCE